MKTTFTIIIFSLFFSTAKSQTTFPKSNHRFKVVGYYFLRSALRDSTYADSNYLFLNKITHLNIAFINPDSNGNFNQKLAIDTLIKNAHQKNIKVLASIAGGGSHEYYHQLLKKNNRQLFISNLIYLVKEYNLDGIDVDLEGDDIDDNYTDFVTELSAALRPLHKLMTAAIATAYKDELPDKALRQFDFVNVMSYDNTGPWRPDDPGDHSPYSMAVEDLDYWHNVRAIPKNKLVLGLPFYGYGFGPKDSPVLSMDYKQIVALYPNAQFSDTLALPGNMFLYFNNKNMIKRKTQLAMQKAGGVMIWELQGDAEGENSLLDVIDEVIKKSEK
ncbi:MAG: glycosyl hydrolase family 18 protein [Ginsengibacter sp.]